MIFSLLANIFSGVGTFLLAYSTFSNKKNKMLWIQTGDCLFNALGDLFVGSFSAMSTNAISGIRNILNARKMNNKYINTIIVVSVVVIGLLINRKEWLGLLPIVASVEYTIWLYIGKTSQSLRYALCVNLLLWFLHDFGVRLYPAIIVDVAVFGITVFNIIRYKKRKDFIYEPQVCLNEKR